MGIGDWGLGIGDWGLGIGPNPQSPIPNPQSPIPILFHFNYIRLFQLINILIKNYIINLSNLNNLNRIIYLKYIGLYIIYTILILKNTNILIIQLSTTLN